MVALVRFEKYGPDAEPVRAEDVAVHVVADKQHFGGSQIHLDQHEFEHPLIRLAVAEVARNQDRIEITGQPG